MAGVLLFDDGGNELCVVAGVLPFFDDGGNEFVSWQVCYFVLMTAVMGLCRCRCVTF